MGFSNYCLAFLIQFGVLYFQIVGNTRCIDQPYNLVGIARTILGYAVSTDDLVRLRVGPLF